MLVRVQIFAKMLNYSAFVDMEHRGQRSYLSFTIVLLFWRMVRNLQVPVVVELK